MKLSLKNFSLGCVLSIFSLTAYAQKWQVADNYEIRFETSNAEGTFKGLNGTIAFDPQKPSEASFDMSLKVSTISTGNSTKDGHARGKRWLNAEVFPTITFVSKEVEPKNGQYFVKGDLQIKGITKEVTIPLSYNNQTFTGSFTITRQDFGIKGSIMSFIVGDEITVNLKVPVKKAF